MLPSAKGSGESWHRAKRIRSGQKKQRPPVRVAVRASSIPTFPEGIAIDRVTVAEEIG
jgi:hypothetical protein